MSYYKDRLGFDPHEPTTNGDALKSKRGYEENLCKFKDERDAIQKKTFTKWVNKHLKKANRHVGDLFIDLQDGLNLISLLEVLSGDQLPRERGKLRFHMLQNVQMALEYLRFKKIKLVNIRAEDIVDGNPKLTLGLIWTIILHFQISDIVVGEEPNVSARDALLKWARKSTSKYPGVRVSDFTSSWRDGMAFNAIIHRNRPDLVDWRTVKSKTVRERLESAFYTAEREYGVTRLLDPEDVDTHEIDEKSIITYISSLHEVFPEPPRLHPLYDSDSQQRTTEYREIANSLNRWMREKLSHMSDRNFPSTLIEMKKLASESTRFRNEELPPRHRDKQHLVHLYKELQKYFEAVGEVDIEPELQADAIDRTWNRLMMTYQDRDSAIQEEIKRLERLQRLAEKVHRETKRTDLKLDELETRIVEEGRRADRLHPLDAKHNADQLETELRLSEDTIQSLFVDVQALREGRYVQAPELQKRVEKLHQKWVNLRSLLHSKVLTPLATLSFPIVEERTVTKQTRTILETRLVDTNTHFRSLQDCIDWCNNKLKQLQEAEYGSDLPSVKALLDQHHREHKIIDQFHTKVEHCINAKANFHGEELALYSQHLNTLQKVYSELVTFSNKRLSDLETLQDFLQSATNQLKWLNEKEEIELNRDWSDKDLNIPSIRQYYESLMSELEKREIQLSSVQDRGEALILQGHPASKCIEAYITALQTQWTWLLQLTLCLETHLKHATYYHQFYADVKEAENWLSKRDDLLNTVYSQSEFTLDEGERLLKGMQDLRDELNNFTEAVGTLEERSRQVVPLKQRRLPVTRPIPVNAICNYKQNGTNVEKGSQWLLHDNSGRVKWRVSRGMNLTDDSNVPGVVFLIPPPDQEALDAVERLRRAYDRTTALWQRKQLRMRQNMIFATIKVVKSWDLAQFLAMGADQRNAIRKALNEDANKLLREGDPADPQLRRLKREMDEVNRLFDEFERLSKAEEDAKNLSRVFNEQAKTIQISLDEYEHTLNTRLSAPIPRDIDTLEHLVIQHKDFETSLKSMGPEVEAMQATFKKIPNKTQAQQTKHDKIVNQWNQLWNLSQLYVERLKCAEITLTGMEEANNIISDFEIKLASYGEMPSELPALKLVHQDLIALQKSVVHHQPAIDQLVEDKNSTRRLTEKSRHHLPRPAHHDLDRLDSDVNRIINRWNNVCSQLVDRLKSCEAAYDLLSKYKNAYQNEVQVVDDTFQKMQARDLNASTRALYNKVQEHTKAIENVNVDGGRFIREAKIYDLRLQHYCAWLVEEVHPSLDASSYQKGQTMDPSAGELAVSHELDVLNHRFQALLNTLIDQLKNLASMNPDDRELQEYVGSLEVRPLRTFRTEFNIYDTVPEVSTNGVNGDQITAVKANGGLLQATMGGHHSSPTTASGADFSDGRTVRRRTADGGAADDDIINTPGIVHPKTGEVLTVGEAIRQRVLDVRTGRIATQPDSKSGWLDIEQAVDRGLVHRGLADKLLGPCAIGGTCITLLEAIQKELLDAERGPMERIKQAMAEKYKLCDDTLTEYLNWIAEIEDRIANQDIAQEDLDQLRNQINVLKLIKEEIDSQLRPITTCLDQVRHIIATGSEFLSREEVNNVEKKGKSLKSRYDHANDRTDKLLRRLVSAKDELSKFKSELTTFTTWMDRAQRTLEEKERALANINRLSDTSSIESTKEFVSDVIAHQADLRFITMAAQKFTDESKEYLTCLNEFRTGLPSRLPHIEPVSSQDSVVKNTVTRVTNNYKDLLSRANALSDKLSGLSSKQREYKDALATAKAWLRDVEPRAVKILNEPIGADPSALEDQLNRTRTLNNEFLGQARLIENVKQAADALIRSLEGQSGIKEIEAIKGPVKDLEDKYRSLCNGLADRLSQLDTALVQSHGVQDALDSLLQWLNDAENSLKNITRPVSLHPERLSEQIREYRLLQSDIDTHRASVDSVAHSTQELMINSSNPRLAKKIEIKLKDVTTRFEKLLDRTAKRGELLNEINQTLSSFNSQASMLEQWLANALENFHDLPENKLDDLIVQRDSQRQTLDQTIRDGKALINNKDVTDTPPVRDRVKGLENQWKNLNQLLDEKHRVSKAKAEQLQAYEKLRDQVLGWLNNTEKRVNQLESVAVDMNIIKNQIEELKPIAKDHRDYSNTIDKLNDLGATFYDTTSYSNSLRRRSSVSPTKRFSLDSLRKTSRDSPRSSFSYNRIEESLDDSPVQQELNEINNRYNLLGVKISDRQNELDTIKDEVRKMVENLKILNQFLDKTQKALPKESIPLSKEESDKAVRQVKAVLEEMYEKQSLLDSTKSGVNDLLRKKPTSLGADKLHDDLQSVTTRWKSLNDICKNRIQLLEDLKDFHDSHDNLSNWLGAKERMLNVLGPISSDSRIVQSQVQQLQVLREEFRTQQPQLTHLTTVGESIISRLPDPHSPDAQRFSNKLEAIRKKWADLLGKLEERASNLGAAADSTREFDAGLARLTGALQNISDQLDDVSYDKEPEERLRKIQNLERQLEGQRPLLADLEDAGNHLCDVLDDPACKADIQSKLAAVNRQYNNLQKKLDNKKAEIEGSLKDGRQFEADCALTLGWLSDNLGSLTERLLISADRDILQQQVAQYEPIYKEVLHKEHEIIMLLNKGRDMLSRAGQRSESRNLQRDLDKIQQNWDKLRKDAVDRHNRLQTCMEHCRKYYRALEAFTPWLTQAENKLEQIKPSNFNKRDVDKQLRELSAFRNEVWKHSGEYENVKTLGETFLASCDVDKELVKQELSAIKNRWDRLNNELTERSQWLEDLSRKLADFSDNLRDSEHALQRCEDKLASHDSVGGAARDPKLLERIKALREDARKLRSPLVSLRQTAGDLASEAAQMGVGDSLKLQDEVDSLMDRLDDLEGKLDDRCSQLQSASTALAQYADKVKTLGKNLNDLEAEFDGLKPPGRDIKTVTGQLDEVDKFIKKIARAGEDVTEMLDFGQRLEDSTSMRDQAESLTRQLNRLDERALNRQADLENVLERLHAFKNKHDNVLHDINHATDEFRNLKPIGSDVEAIKFQQKEFATFRKNTIEPLVASVNEVNGLGQRLVQSAARGVNTSVLEKDLEKMNDKWNALKEKLNERDRRLDYGLLQSGKFQEALDGFAKWLADTEELVSNQKPPSADYKVVKAQLQEQKFLKKMLADRQNSMGSIFDMGNEVAANADPRERKEIEQQLKDLSQRFNNLDRGATKRMDDLQRAMVVAKEFIEKLTPLLEWLDKSEKKIKDMELVPTDEEKIQQRIKEHNKLHNEILDKNPDFKDLTDIASTLMALVGEDEATGVADRIQETADRYATLVNTSERLGQLLQDSRSGLRHLVLTYQDLQAWMEGMENRLGRYKVLPVHTDKLAQQMEDIADLCEEISNKQSDVDGTVDSGMELIKHITSDEAIQLKDKLDVLQRRYNDLVTTGTDLLKNAEGMLPLVQQFHNAHKRLGDWMLSAESQLQMADPKEEDIHNLELDIQEFRPVLESINQIGPQLCQMSPGEGAATIEGLVSRDNRRFDAICEQIQRKAERIQLSKQRSLEVIGDMDDLLDWFREVENQLKEAEPPSSEVDIIRVQLKEHKALNDDISSQKGRGRDVLSMAKKVLREVTQNNDASLMREKMEDLREVMETVSSLSAERLSVLEQALPLALHFQESHFDLSRWLDEMERQMQMLAMPALRPELIAQQQDKNEQFIQSISEHKPLVDKLNKTGEALIRLCNEDEGMKIQDILDSDNSRYNALRAELRQRQQALEKALQETSQFSDKLEGMLRALQNTAEQVSGAEPISAHPPKIRDQQDENDAVVEDLHKRADAFQAVKKAANDVINKAPNSSDPAVKDIKRKLDRLNSLWNDVQEATNDRGRSLEEALILAERFWEELQNVMATLKNIQDSLLSQDAPAVEPAMLKKQKAALKEIKAEIDQTKPEVEQCRVSGQKLMKVCGEPDKPEVKKHIEDLDNAWETVTALFAKCEENLIKAMDKAMEFHETLQDLLKFLDGAERRFANLGPLGTDIQVVKKQIGELKNFKSDIDPQMVKVEALNRQAQELTERTSAEQAAALKQPLSEVNRRWENLLKGIVERQRQLENSLLRLGQFHHALAELLAWIDSTNKTLDKDLKPVAGDSQLLEVELAKLKVLVNDIQAHQSSVDTLNDAGRQLIESSKGSAEANNTQDKLNLLNKNWRDLLQKAADRQLELEDALSDAQRFAAEIQDLLSWLGEVDGVIATSKPVGGLPETASEQLERFMEVYNELEANRPKVETVLAQGQEYLKKSPGSGNLAQNLKTLKQRWDSVTARANDKKIKLEIALKEATEFHNALQAFVDWLTDAEKTLSNLKPVSRILPTILSQIEDHKSFQKDVSSHREVMLHLDKKGTHLKYFSQKQDVILIKNLLISVQHRFERVVSKSAERTRALDHGYKEAREFHEAWSGLMDWLSNTEKNLDELAQDATVGNDPDRIKQRLAKHRDVQRALSAKQATYDSTMRMGKALKEKAPKSDEHPLNKMINELKEKWNLVCTKTVDRQRKLEEALLYCGQFKDAMEALLDWLRKAEKRLIDDGPVHGDLDTVMALVEQHKAFEESLSKRHDQMQTVKQTGKDLMSKASPSDRAVIQSQLDDLENQWNRTSKLCDKRTDKLEDALRQAEQLHKSVHLLLEWLSDAEMKLRFIGPLPDNEQETRQQLNDHRKFMEEMTDKQHEKDSTVNLAKKILEKAHPDAVNVIKHWITIIQSRWEEVWTWAKQREQKLMDHLQSLQDLDSLLEELFAWLTKLENRLLDLESEPLPDSIEVTEKLIEEHREFMENTAKRQSEVDAVCKAKQPAAPAGRKPSAIKKTSAASREDLAGSVHDLSDQRKHSRASPVIKEKPADQLPHIGPRFPAKGSKVEEPLLRNTRCRQLWDKWHNVWLMAWERQRRLQEHLNYLREVEKVRNFSWDQWRKRFLKFMNHKKSRLTDLFRKMDKNNDGLIPRDDFIDGIMKTKFDTSKLEMNAVADMFDHDRLGLIDWKEFIAALRPDWEEKKPDTEAEKIHDEVKRLVMLCTCRQKFRVFQVGEGRYRFGDSQKLRLVRILRSTVMVRVGGGWVALDEFLVKNDPCRAKGRTNIELREQFILADGVSQSMSAFKPKHNVQQQPRSGSTAGPITKVRERSARSVPMGKTGVNRTAGTPDSLSDNESSPYSRTPARKGSTPVTRKSSVGGVTSSLPASRPASRPQSRQGSKPPSRHGSNLSLDSTDSNTPSRIPRLTPGKTSTTPRKANGQVVSGRVRSPSAVANQSNTPSTRSSLSMHRSSSIPTLSNSSSSRSQGSKIPVLLGQPSSRDSTMPMVSPMSSTPSSGLQSPLATPTSTNLSRKPSNASETKRRNSKPDSREPFRL